MNVPTTGHPQAIGLAELLKLVRRHLLMIVVVTAVMTALAAYVLSTIAPRYTADALLVIDSRGANVVNVDTLMAGLSSDPETVMSEIQVLKSRRLANLVIDQLSLHTRPEFNVELREPGLFGRTADAQAAGGPALTGAAAGSALVRGERVRVIDKFLERLSVEPRPGSRAVQVTFSSEDPETAAVVANALIDLYLVDQLESKYESVQRAADWLNARVASLREKVRESEGRVEEFRERSGLLEGGGTTLTDQEISQINRQVIDAGNQRAVAEANLRQIRRLLRTPSGVESAGEVLNSALIQRLREQEAGIQRRIAELSSEYGDRHPTMEKMRAEAADLAAKIDAEIKKIVSGLENRVRIARSNESNLNRNLESAKERVGLDNKALVTLRSLEREAEANRLVLEGMLTRFAQTSEQDDLASQRPDARVISRAVVPQEPSYPMKNAILALVFVGALFIGLMLAFAREFMDEGFRSGEQFEASTGLRSLGFMPRLSRRDLSRQSPLEYFLANPSTPFSESIRTLYASLSTASVDDAAPKSILIASSVANEGKTTVAVCLASLMALSGKRVIIIDGDCRRPDVETQLKAGDGPGLMEYLGSQLALEEIVRSDEVSGADIIGAGRATNNPPASLGSERFAQLLQILEAKYDYVIVDSPPVMAVSDAIAMAPQLDVAVVVTRWGHTRRSAVALSIRQLQNAGAHMGGGFLTIVDVRRYAQYGYGDAGAYTGELASYQRV